MVRCLVPIGAAVEEVTCEIATSMRIMRVRIGKWLVEDYITGRLATERSLEIIKIIIISRWSPPIVMLDPKIEVLMTPKLSSQSGLRSVADMSKDRMHAEQTSTGCV